MEHNTIRLLYVKYALSIRVSYRWYSDFATDWSCGIWRHGFTACFLYVSPLFWNPNFKRKLIYKFHIAENVFSLFWHLYMYIYIYTYIYQNISLYIDTIFFIRLIFMSQIVFIFTKYPCIIFSHRQSLDSLYVCEFVFIHSAYCWKIVGLLMN